MKLCASRQSAARGGQRHTHGSWLINAPLPLLVSIKEMTCHTQALHITVQNPSCPWEEHFTALSLSLGHITESNFGDLFWKTKLETLHTVQPCATGNPKDRPRNNSRLAFPQENYSQGPVSFGKLILFYLPLK